MAFLKEITNKLNKPANKIILKSKNLETNLLTLIEIDDKNSLNNFDQMNSLIKIANSVQSHFLIKNEDFQIYKKTVDEILLLILEYNFSIETASSSLFLLKKMMPRFKLTPSNVKNVCLCVFYIQSKYEELTVPLIDEIIDKSTLRKEKFIKLEGNILKVVDFDLNFISGMNFIRFFSKLNFYQQRTHQMAKLLYVFSFYFNTEYNEMEVSIGAFLAAEKFLGRKYDWLFLYLDSDKNVIIEVAEKILDYCFNEINPYEFEKGPAYKMFNKKSTGFVSKFLLEKLLENKEN